MARLFALSRRGNAEVSRQERPYGAVTLGAGRPLRERRHSSKRCTMTKTDGTNRTARQVEAIIRCVVVERGDARDGDHLIDARRLARDLSDLLEHLLGALQRRPVGKPNGGQKVALALDGEKAGRHARKPRCREADDRQRDEHHHAAAADHPGDQARVTALDAVVGGIEGTLHRVALGGRHRPPQPHRRLRGLERCGIDGAEQRGLASCPSFALHGTRTSRDPSSDVLEE